MLVPATATAAAAAAAAAAALPVRRLREVVGSVGCRR